MSLRQPLHDQTRPSVQNGLQPLQLAPVCRMCAHTGHFKRCVQPSAHITVTALTRLCLKQLSGPKRQRRACLLLALLLMLWPAKCEKACQLPASPPAIASRARWRCVLTSCSCASVDTRGLIARAYLR